MITRFTLAAHLKCNIKCLYIKRNFQIRYHLTTVSVNLSFFEGKYYINQARKPDSTKSIRYKSVKMMYDYPLILPPNTCFHALRIKLNEVFRFSNVNHRNFEILRVSKFHFGTSNTGPCVLVSALLDSSRATCNEND